MEKTIYKPMEQPWEQNWLWRLQTSPWANYREINTQTELKQTTSVEKVYWRRVLAVEHKRG